MKYGILLYLASSALALQAFGNEFDFGEEAEDTSEASHDGSENSFLTNKLVFSLGRQTGDPQRWVDQSLTLNSKLDVSITEGTILFGQASLSYNQAYKTENDSQLVADEHTITPQLKELYLQKSSEIASLTFGRKVIVPGKADFLSPLDRFSAKDSSALFFAPPEEARLGQNLLQIDFWLNKWVETTGLFESKIGFTYFPNLRPNLHPSKGHPYRLIPSVEAENRINTELSGHLVSYKLVINNHSLELVSGKSVNLDPLVEITKAGKTAHGYRNYTFNGLGYTYSNTATLYKAEVAQSSQLPYQGYQLDPLMGLNIPTIELTNSTSSTLGFDHQIDDLTTFSLETNWTSYQAESLTFDRQINVSLSSSALNETLTYQLFIGLLDNLKTRMTRVESTYKLTDNLEVGAKYTMITSESDRSEYRGLEHYDRADLSLAFAF